MPKNAIALRLEQLSDQWQEFVSVPNARLLIWQLRASELRMVDAFFQAEADERAAEHAELFLPLHTPFENPVGHGFLLRKAIADEYARSSEALRQIDIANDWEPPKERKQERDIAHLIRTCESLHEHYALPGKLVLVLRPDEVTDAAAYQVWLGQLATEAPESLRAIVLDPVEQPAFAALIASRSARVAVVPADLDMPGALQQLSNAAGNLDTPGGQFRDLFVRLHNLLAEDDLPGALGLGEAALALIGEHRLWHLSVPIHFALAGGLSGQGRSDEAILQFTAAEAAALRGEQDGAEEARGLCKTLRLHARLGHGTALLTAQADARAAQHFSESAPLALALGDRRTALDCKRLASFGWERAGKLEQALRAGRAGLELAKAMDRASLETSTFEYLAQALVRLTAGEDKLQLRQQLERELSELRARIRADDGAGAEARAEGAAAREPA